MYYSDKSDGANDLRRAAQCSRERAVYLEQAISWLRARVEYLEDEISAHEMCEEDLISKLEQAQ